MQSVEASGIEALFAAQKAATLARRQSFGLQERRAALRRLRDVLAAHEAEVIAALAQDFGKPEAEVRMTELLPLSLDINLALKKLPAWMKERRLGPTLATIGTSARLRREPRGTCLIIAPWNYPLHLALSPLVSCLAAGNSAILKPSELAPATSSLLARLIGKAFEPDLVAVCEGDVETSTALLALPFDHIFFTGSPEVGRVVMRAAARHLSTVTLELGGKSPAILGPTADIEQAADWLVFGKFTNAGQTCIAPDHIYVPSHLTAPLRQALMARITRSYGGQGAPDLARIISPRHAERLRQMLSEAKAAGATLSKADWGEGTTLPPVLVEGGGDDLSLWQDEIFGPIFPIRSYDDVADVISQINARPKPLALYVFEKDPAFAQSVIAQTSSGGVGVNLTLLHYTHHGLPFGGVNQSGHGQAHGEWGFRAFSHERAILRNRFSIVKAFGAPYTQTKLRLIRLASAWLR